MHSSQVDQPAPSTPDAPTPVGGSGTPGGRSHGGPVGGAGGGPGGGPGASSGGGGHFRYVPALDGLRAFAVLGVIAFHTGVPFLPGGYLGVDAFFVLSGFLITSLLLAEWRSSAGIGLRAFWARRARRLLPALFLLLVGVSLYARFVAPPGMYPGLRLDELATLFYVANWHFILTGANYFVQTGPPSLLLHTWSLAIEEQFYLIWPLVVLALMRWAKSLWTVLWVAIAGAVASSVEMALLYGPGEEQTRVYFGTDTHAQSLLIGAALGVALLIWRRSRSEEISDEAGREAGLTRHMQVVAAVVGIAGFGAAAWCWVRFGYDDSFVFPYGIVIAGLAVAAVIASAALSPAGPVSRLLSLPPLRFLGRISYGMYLFHWPIVQYMHYEAPFHLTGYALFGTVVGATVVVSTASYYLLERPIRQGTFFTSLRSWLATPVAFAVVVVVVLVGTSVPSAYPVTPHAPSGRPVPLAEQKSVLLVGDSVALTLGMGLSAETPYYGIDLHDEGILGCGVAIGSEYRSHGVVYPVGWACNTHPAPGYVQWPVAWRQWIAKYQPKVVVLLAGRWEVMNRTYHGRWVHIGEPAYDDYLVHQLQLAVQVATSGGAHMVIETAPCYSSGEQPDGLPWPEDSPRRLAEYNAMVAEMGRMYPGKVTVQNLDGLVCPGGHFEATMDGMGLRCADGVHFTVGGGEMLAPKLLPLWGRLAGFEGPFPKKVHLTPAAFGFGCAPGGGPG